MNRDHGEVIREFLDLAGKRVLDIGCGNGHIARLMTELGATVTGIDPNGKQLERARASQPAGDETYIEGVGEDLPFEDGSVDIVVFFNSLHHLPAGSLDKGLAEAARVLNPGGRVYITEPMAEGPLFEMHKPFNDETEVRARAQEAIAAASALGFRRAAGTTYVSDAVLESFEAMREGMTAINPGRRAKIDAVETEVRASFERLGEKQPDGHHFPQPIKVDLLEKI